jgi:hypothetical protein
MTSAQIAKWGNETNSVALYRRATYATAFGLVMAAARKTKRMITPFSPAIHEGR